MTTQKWKKRMWWIAGSTLVLVVGTGVTLWSLGFWPTTLSQPSMTEQEAIEQAKYLSSMFHKILKKHVNTKGRVNYKTLAQEQTTLDRYLSVLANVSPNSHPKLFSTHQDRLAYWINAYNASVLRAVLQVSPWNNLISYPRKVRFFALLRFLYGGKRYNLYDLENCLIRPRFQEPRVHFALNCASIGCPHLPPEAFTGAKLEAQLNREAKKFVSQSRNVRVDEANKTIHLSSIFQWFRLDFTNWLQAQKKPKQASDRILDFINLYRPKNQQIPLQGYKVAYIPYDWNLNQQ